MNLNKKHKGATIFNISDNISLRLVNIDFRKTPEDFTGEFMYTLHKAYVGYNVEIFAKNTKQKKRFRNGYCEDSVGKGDVRDLIEIKNKLYEISHYLQDHEFLIIEGADERRRKIYQHFLLKDERSVNKLFGDTNGVLYLFNDTGVSVWKYIDIVEGYDDNKCAIFDKKILKQREKEWRDMII